MTAPALPPLPLEVKQALDDLIDRVLEVGRDPMRVVEGAEAYAALVRAIARALDGDGEPVAWGVMGSNGKCYEPFLSGADAAAKAEMATMAGYGGAPFTVAPLFTRPTATGDTGEGGGGA